MKEVDGEGVKELTRKQKERKSKQSEKFEKSYGPIY